MWYVYVFFFSLSIEEAEEDDDDGDGEEDGEHTITVENGDVLRNLLHGQEHNKDAEEEGD